VILDLWSNASVTGDSSEVYFIKALIDGLLIAFALFMAYGMGKTATRERAAIEVKDTSNNITAFENVASWEYIYCGVLVVYALLNAYGLHAINRDATGIAAFLSLIWTFVSLAVAIFAAIQFYHLKQGDIVALKKKIVSD
jgi:large-conductance mechanosensitive channel